MPRRALPPQVGFALMDVDGIHVEVDGPERGMPIVFVHGAPDRATSFRPVLPHLEGRRVVTYDRRGYGRSLEATPPTGMADHARDLLAIVDRVGGRAVVVAHSFGSNPTMLASTLRPEAFAALGLWEPPLVWTAPWPQHMRDFNEDVVGAADREAKMEEIYRQLLGDERWDELPEDVQAARRAEGEAFRVDMASELVEPFRFEDVVVPAVVGYGTDTATCHADGSIWLVEHLKDARLHVIEGAGHFGHRSHPEAYAGFVRAALALAAD